MSVRRDLRPLLAIAVLGVIVALAESVTGLHTGLLLLSPALVLHHYGSKAGLRAAVDQYAAAQFDALFEDADGVGELLTAGSSASIAELFARALPADSPLPAYFRRLVLEGDPAGGALFRR